MNMLLISVTTRTREIGLRKALGASALVILIQFLAEGIFISLAGGLLGLLIGHVSAVIMRMLPGTHLESATVPGWAVVTSCSLSVGIGVVFGLLPAIQAARLPPAKALRHE